MPSEEQIAQFVACRTHAEKVACFQANPELAALFRSEMFSEATLAPVVPSTP